MSIPLKLALLVLMLLVALSGSLLVGPAPLSFGDVLAGLFGQADDPRIPLVVVDIRLPRALLGALVGGALGLSGAALQGLVRNPLAEPGLIGASSCAGLGAVVMLYGGWAALVPWGLPLAAIVMAGLGTILVLAIAGREADSQTLILAGVAVSSLAVALTSLAMSLSPNPFALSEIVLWLLGSLRDRSLNDVLMALPFMTAGALLLIPAAVGLNALSLGEQTAESLGISVRRLRLLVIAAVSLLSGAAVAVAGSVGFVGLVVPHLLRPWFDYTPSRLLLPSALGGAILVTCADIAVRLIPNQGEMLLGVLTSLLGAPFFLMLIVKMRRGKR